jgi:hypothetical protein
VAVIAALWLALPRAAHAEDAASLVADGQDLARAGNIQAAIAKFSAADQLEPRAIHSCLIALAYLRRDELASAQLMFTQCHDRATEPLPAWVTIEEQQLETRVASAGLGTVELTVDPAIVTITVPALLGGVPFAARTRLSLPPGVHRIEGRTAVGRTVAVDVMVVRGRSVPATLVIPPPEPPATVAPRPAVPRPRPRSSMPSYLMIGGGVALAVGGAIHVFALRPARSELADATTPEAYDAQYSAFARSRYATIGSYTIGAAALIAGVVLSRRSDEGPQLLTHVGQGGAIVTLVWDR